MSNHKQIRGVVDAYFDGIHRGDTRQLSEVFHRDAVVIDNVLGAFRKRAAEEYVAGVGSRPSPASMGEARDMHLLYLDVLGEQAVVTARLNFSGHKYFNVLTLLRHADHWLVVSKCFVSVPET